MGKKNDSVFGDRHLPSEELYFNNREFGKYDIGFALTDGGAEMAYPTVGLGGGELRMLTSEQLERPGLIKGVGGRHVWLFDDGELPDETLAQAARMLSQCGAATVGVVSAVASRQLRRKAGSGVIKTLRTLKWREQLSGDRPLYASPARPAEVWVNSVSAMHGTRYLQRDACAPTVESMADDMARVHARMEYDRHGAAKDRKQWRQKPHVPNPPKANGSCQQVRLGNHFDFKFDYDSDCRLAVEPNTAVEGKIMINRFVGEACDYGRLELRVFAVDTDGFLSEPTVVTVDVVDEDIDEEPAEVDEFALSVK